MSRPPIPIDMPKLQALMRFKPRLEDAAAFFQCSQDTIERRIREFTKSDENPDGVSFAVFRDQNMVHTRFKLIQTALQKAESGDNTMLIFSLKNLCDWNDGRTAEVKVDVNNFTGTPTEDMEKRLKTLLDKALAEKPTDEEPRT